MKIIDNDVTLIPLVDEILFLEKQLEELKKLPFLKCHPRDPTKQKATLAAKRYKEFLQHNIVCSRHKLASSGITGDVLNFVGLYGIT